MYVDGPNGTRICTKHETEFKPPHQCPKCKPARDALTRSPSATSGSPEYDDVIRDEILRFEAMAEDFDEQGENAASDAGKVGFARARLTAATRASDLRMQRANADRLNRLKAGGKAITVARDPREDWGTAAEGEIHADEGNN